MRRIRIAGLAALLAICWLGMRPAANTLESISMARQGDSIAVTITTGTDCEYDAFLTDSKPERIVIDLNGVINDMPQQRFMDLPVKSIKSIRTSQYKSAPEPQARVVLDINRPIEFADSRVGNSVIIKIAAIPDEFASANWEFPGPMNAAVTAPVAEDPGVDEIEEPEETVEEPPAATENPKQKPAEKPVEIVQAPSTPVEEPQPVSERPDAISESQQEAEDEPAAPSQVSELTPMPVSKGSVIDNAPKRKSIEYTADDEKDPFASLIGKVTGKRANELPSLENLKLVGILEDNITSSALFEDGEGNGYILQPNDRIQSGYLVSVSDNKATFRITEYGWTRTVALELQVPDIK
jgi:hypothetical protein